jgi:hypothetical protein
MAAGEAANSAAVKSKLVELGVPVVESNKRWRDSVMGDLFSGISFLDEDCGLLQR